jgi:predicted MFS family arabinose efflux permease
VLFWASLFLYAPVLPGYAASRGASLTMVGMVVGAYGVTQLALRLPIGIAADRWNARRAFVAAGLAASAAGALLLALAPSPALLVAGRALAGAAAACWVVLVVVAVGALPSHRLPEAMSAVTVAGTVAEAAAVLAGGILADTAGWTAPFLVAAALAALGLVPATRLTGSLAGCDAATWPRLARAATRPRLLLVSAVTTLVTFAVYATTYSFVPVVARHLGARQTDIGVVTMLAQAGFAAGALAAGRAARHVAPSRLLALGAALVAASSAATPALPGLLSLDAAQLLGGLGRGLVNPVAATLAIERVPDAERTTAMGVYQATWAAGIVLGPPVAGRLADSHGLPAAFLAAALAATLAAVLGLGLHGDGKRSGIAGGR